MTDTVFILDRNKNVIDYLSNNGVSPDAPFFDDIYIQELSNGVETYEFSTLSNARTSEALELGNYVVFKYDNKYKMFQIMDLEDNHKDGKQIINCYCEMAGLELLTDYCEPFKIEGNVELFFNTVLQDTNWQLGGYSESLITNIQSISVDKYTNVYKVIQENISTYNNVEIEYRVEFDGNRLLGYFIDVYENGYRGSKVYKRFEYGENVSGITRKRNLNDFASAMIGQGKDKLTFKDIEWKKSNGDPADKPKGQDFVVDLEANDKFNKHGKYIKGLFDDSDITNPQDLLLKSWGKLQELKEPKFDYDVELALTSVEYEDIKIGDTNYVIDNDYNPPIFLEARIGKLEISLTNPNKNKCTLSNYKEVVSKIREPKDGENGKTPEIGNNGNWWIGGFDTGKPAQGGQGLPGKDGEPAKYVRVAGEQVFKYANGFAGTPTPSVITIASSVIGVTNPSRVWSYKTPSMSNYVNMSSTDANIVIMHNDEIWGTDNSITVRCSVGDKYDQITLVKVVDGEDGLNGADGDPAYTILLSNENHAFPCQFNGNIPSAITTTTKAIALKGTKEITPTIVTLPTIPGLTLTKSGATITVVANVGTNLADYGSFDIPITVDGIGFTKTFTWSKSKAGANGTNGTNGSNGISPLNATLSGQSLMKYLDKTTAPTPATIAIKCKAMKGATEVTGACSYQWQAYYNDAWNDIGTGSSMNIAYNSSYFLNLDILQIRVNVAYGNETITLEHTISKVYDNKYITQQEIFNKLTENGNDFLYTDPDTGKIYINVTYAKAGQLVADLIKGGILTLGGTGDNSISDYGVLRFLDYEGINEVARINGGEAWFEDLNLTDLNAENIVADNIECNKVSKLVSMTDCPSTFYVNEDASGDGSGFDTNNYADSIQGILNFIWDNYGNILCKNIKIIVKNGSRIEEDIYIRGWSGWGGLDIYFEYYTQYWGTINCSDNTIRTYIVCENDGTDTGSLTPTSQTEMKKRARLYTTAGDNGIKVANAYLAVNKVVAINNVSSGYSDTFAYFSSGARGYVTGCDVMNYDSLIYVGTGSTVGITSCCGDVNYYYSGGGGGHIMSGGRVAKYKTALRNKNTGLSVFSLDGSENQQSSIYKYGTNDYGGSSSGSTGSTTTTKTTYIKTYTLTNLRTTTTGSGYTTSSKTGCTGQGRNGSYKNHLGHATIPSSCISNLAKASSISYVKLKMTRLTTSHGSAGAVPYPVIKAGSSTQSASDYKFARGDTKTIPLSGSIINAIKGGATDLQLAGTGTSQYSFYNKLTLEIKYTVG